MLKNACPLCLLTIPALGIMLGLQACSAQPERVAGGERVATTQSSTIKTTTSTESDMATAKAMFGAGCFWGVEATFRQVEGVVTTAVGYAGGNVREPSYQDVCTGTTGHAEVVHVEYDPTLVSYDRLLDVFFNSHDPTQVNRQGPDVGEQYRSVIFYYDDAQREKAESTIASLTEQNRFPRPIATKVESAPSFYRAEEYHQQYLAKRGKTSCATTVRDE
jgi:peptide-methionine (S)-S-oxide reductase